MRTLEHVLEREILIRARRATVFSFFTESARFAEWWGQGSTIDGRVGGAVRIQMPGNTVVLGEVLELVPEQRIVFTYGFETGVPIPLGGSRVTVTLRSHIDGTLVRLHHEFGDAHVRDHHVQGWRYQLAVFANVAAAVEHAQLASRLDRYFAAWGEPNIETREAELQACTTDDVTFRDQYGCTIGRADLLAHVAAVLVHMPGMHLRRVGEPRQCQGTALVSWEAVTADGSPRGSGTNFVKLAPDGRIAGVVGFWGG